MVPQVWAVLLENRMLGVSICSRVFQSKERATRFIYWARGELDKAFAAADAMAQAQKRKDKELGIIPDVDVYYTHRFMDWKTFKGHINEPRLIEELVTDARDLSWTAEEVPHYV